MSATASFGLLFLTSNSESPQQHRADEQKGDAGGQDIESQGKVHNGLPLLAEIRLAEAVTGSKQETHCDAKSALPVDGR